MLLWLLSAILMRPSCLLQKLSSGPFTPSLVDAQLWAWRGDMLERRSQGTPERGHRAILGRAEAGEQALASVHDEVPHARARRHRPDEVAELLIRVGIVHACSASICCFRAYPGALAQKVKGTMRQVHDSQRSLQRLRRKDHTWPLATGCCLA